MKPKDLVKILAKSKMKYGYNKDTKIYTVKFFIKKGGKKELRILTVMAAPKFIEYSIADEKGNTLEMLRQEGSKIRFENFK